LGRGSCIFVAYEHKRNSRNKQQNDQSRDETPR
jgi:hypothetical protein